MQQILTKFSTAMLNLTIQSRRLSQQDKAKWSNQA